jgi:hypothetical protein
MTKEFEAFFDLLNKQSELTPAEIEVREKYFRTEIYGTENFGEARAKLNDFFFVDPKETIEKSKRFWYSYWRWFAMLNWSGFMGLSEADMLFSFAYQVPMAVALDYNPADELRRYLALNCPFEEDMVGMYSKVLPAFLSSEAYAGMWQGKEVYLSEIIQELTDTGFEEDSLRQSEFQNKLSQILFYNNELSEKYFFTTSDVAVKKFISLVIFLQSVDQNEIWLSVDNFMYPDKYKDKILAEISSSTTPTSSTPISPKPVSAPTAPPPPQVRPATSLQPAPKQEAKPRAELPSGSGAGEPKLVVPSTIRPKSSPAQIKSEIESQFKKDAEGNFADIEGVMAKLGELAEKNNDSKIAEMIYFDEKENKFKWNT